LIDPNQSSSAIEVEKSFFLDDVVGRHMQKKFVLTNFQESIARLSFFKRLGIEKGIDSRTNKLHDEPMNHELCDCVEHLLRSSKSIPRSSRAHHPMSPPSQALGQSAKYGRSFEQA